MKTVLIIGLGISGSSAAAFLLNQNIQVIAVDQKNKSLQETAHVKDLMKNGLQFFERLDHLEGIDQVILSPGVNPNHPLVKKALELGIEVIGEAEFALREIKNRCVAITGSNGKTTTVLLIEHILNSAGKKAKAVGNVGKSLSEELLTTKGDEILVVELSSYQLETLEKKAFEAALVLNITPNHLDRYPSMREYAEAKGRIEKCLKPGGKLYISKQVKEEWGDLFHCYEVYDISSNYKDIAPKQNLSYIKLGVPELSSILAAYSIVKFLGVADKEFQEGLLSFRKPPHRIEWVAEIERVAYYNDSKSSNVESVLHAARQFKGPLILLAGGVHKGASYAPWMEPFRGKVKKIIAFGEASAIMEEELGVEFPFSKVENLREALLLANRMAVEGDTVILSPGCSSFDQFRNFEHRGEEFKRIVSSL